MTKQERPIFIVGSARSGTTLLRFMLGQHPRLFIPPQSSFIPLLFANKASGLLSRGDALHAVRTIFTARPFIKHWTEPLPDPDDFLDALPDQTAATILDAVYLRYAQQHGAARWGDKTPIYSAYIDLLAAIFPHAQFIHIIRDGRDVALSLMRTYANKPHVDIYYGAATWRYYVGRVLASAKKLLPDQYIEVRYDELTADPEMELKRLCGFLGEFYDPRMLHPHELARQTVSKTNVHAETRQPITTSHIGKWQRQMSLRDQRLFHAVAGDLLIQLGYMPSDAGEMNTSERARLLGLRGKYAALNGGRRILQSIGVFDPH